MAARTAPRDGLKVLLLERRKKIGNVRRYCSQLIRVGSGGLSSRMTPTDRVIKNILGLWTNHSFHPGIAAPLFTRMDLPGMLRRVMTESPFASWFRWSKVIDRLGCAMSLRPAIREPARGKVICCGDNAAFAETVIKGDVLRDNLNRLREELPAIAEKTAGPAAGYREEY